MAAAFAVSGWSEKLAMRIRSQHVSGSLVAPVNNVRWLQRARAVRRDVATLLISRMHRNASVVRVEMGRLPVLELSK